MINVLITCIGGYYGIDTIEALKSDSEIDINVIGVDADSTVVNRNFVDTFFCIPNADEDPESFINSLYEICEKYNVDIIIPGADEEAYALSSSKDIFERLGVKCAVQDKDIMEIISDKLVFFNKMSELNIRTPKFSGVSNLDDLINNSDYLGFPDKRIILKPRVGRGARGLMVIDDQIASPTEGQESRGYWLGNIESAIKYLGNKQSFNNSDLRLIAMEYLPGDIYDVDCVANNGLPIAIIPRKRLANTPFSRGVEGHEIDNNETILDITTETIKALSLGYVFDCDFGTHANGEPGILEINPRWSGSVAASLGSGVNIPSLIVRVLMGIEFDQIEPTYGNKIFPTTRMGFLS